MTAERSNQGIGQLSVLCRWTCSALLAAPLGYWWSFGYEGDAVILLVLALLSLIAGLVRFGNSIYGLFRYRDRRQRATSTFPLLLSVAGVLAMPYVLLGWKM